MADWSAKLKLPYIAAAQAQKHVTHNEALALLDAIVQLTLEGFDLVNPPALPPEGAVYALGGGATGAWAGQDGTLALASNGGWQFVQPQPGWRAAQGSDLRLWDGADWVPPPLPDLQNLPGLGIGTSYSPGNPLSVAGEATLLTHAGAGHQIKINKASAGDTASLLLQTGWSGRAEMGTAGTDDFAIKVSPDGSTWFPALTALAASGRLQFGAEVAAQPGSAAAPGLGFVTDADTGLFSIADNSLGLATGGVQRARVHNGGLEVSGAMTGTAVTQSATDATAGRLMKVGDFGLGGNAPSLPGDDLNNTFQTGAYVITSSTLNAPGTAASGVVQVISRSVSASAAPAQFHFVMKNRSGGGVSMWVRNVTGSVFGAWQEVYNQSGLLGAVSQAAGRPTGAVIERGSNANGDYTRFADGTQICSRTMAASAGAATSWTFPASFSVAPVVCGAAVAVVLSAICLDAAPTTTGVTFSARDKTDARRADSCHLTATGRWF